MRWYFKAAIQGAISLMPDSARWNYFAQKNINHSFADKQRWLSHRFALCAQHLDHYFQFQPQREFPGSILELGTGWIPTVPIGLFLCGANQIYTIDIQQLIRQDLFHEILTYIRTLSLADICRYLPRTQPERFAALQNVIGQASSADIVEVLKRLNITYVIGDARATNFDPGTIDLIISNTTLEHIDKAILDAIFREFRRIIHPDGLMSHFVDMGDHYSHSDPSITPYNFFRYESNVWRLFNNSLLYQNRLRVSDYRAIQLQNEFEIIFEQVNDSRKSQLDGIKLAPEFERYTKDDLAPTSTWQVSKPAENSNDR